MEMLGLRLVAVALDSRQVHFYQDKSLVDIIECDDVVTAMRWGRLGREDNTLVMVSRGGCLTIKILKRTAKFVGRELTDNGQSADLAANSRLTIPKKTKLFVDQTMREREQAISKCMHL